MAAGTSGEELDLSDEWEAISAEVHEVPAAAAEEPVAAQVELDPVLAPEQTAGEPKTIEAAAPSSPVEEIVVHADAEPDYDAKVEHFEIDANTAQAELSAHAPPAEESSLDALLAETSAEAEPEPAIEIVEEAAEPAAGPVSSAEAETEALPAALVEFLNEPVPEVAAEGAPSQQRNRIGTYSRAGRQRESAPPATTDDFISELVAELDDLEGPAAPNVAGTSASRKPG